MSATKEFEATLRRIETVTGLAFSIDKDCAGYRVAETHGARYLSPRLKPAAMRRWLDGFETALNYMRRKP